MGRKEAIPARSQPAAGLGRDGLHREQPACPHRQRGLHDQRRWTVDASQEGTAAAGFAVVHADGGQRRGSMWCASLKKYRSTAKREHQMSGSLSRHAITMSAAFVLIALPTAAPAQGGIPGVLAPGVSSVLVQEGFEFTEGPVGTADGGLYFSDIRVNNRRGKTYHVDSAGKITLVREPTNGANGLALTKDGELLFAESESRSITKRNRDGSI